ncbi:hypothetical protein [Lysobacter enzymogenes]|uniref:hypothetical protein n=1 Tax=Lysobacter enzymogenes TaxID=69 RepID=UPI000899845C|nr:hypothetical protein [Lysobacter enzymogenes]SDW93499.1 hypothetical protein SAMN05421681_103269 [Lysobacter enzymogenes]
MNLAEWLKSGRYLPPILRDFHDQKAVFRTMHELVGDDGGGFQRPSWIDGQVYVIDVFLWFMAKRGYTLQRSRQRVEFFDLDADLRDAERRRDKAFADALVQSRMNTNEERGDGG